MNIYKTFLWRTRLLNEKLWFMWDTSSLKERIQVWLQSRRRKKAIRWANKKHKADGKRYYVLSDARGKLVVLNRAEIEYLKKAGIMSRKVNVVDLLKESLYFTP